MHNCTSGAVGGAGRGSLMCAPLEGTIGMSGVFASEWAEERRGNARLVAFHSSHPRDPTALPHGGYEGHPSREECMGRSGTLALLLMAACSGAFAQSSGATDNELYAGYCKGAVDAIGQATAETERMSRRFSAYPWATGAMTDTKRRDAVLGIGAAIARGRADQQRCNATMDACSQTILGKPGSPLPKDNRASQLQACISSDPSCPRASRCYTPDPLPF